MAFILQRTFHLSLTYLFHAEHQLQCAQLCELVVSQLHAPECYCKGKQIHSNSVRFLIVS